MNKHKWIIILALLTLKAITSFSQTVDGPANFRDNPNGKVILQLQNGVQISVKDSLSGWYKCIFTGYAEIPQKITDLTLVPKGTKLYSKELKLAGEVMYPIKYKYKGQIFKQKYALIEIFAYTHSKNIVQKIQNSTTEKLIWNNSELSDFKYYTTGEEYGGFSISKKTDFHEEYIYCNNKFDRCLIKEKKTQKRSDNIDYVESKINLEFYPNYYNGDYKTMKYINIEANNVFFSSDYFFSEILGCCDETNKYTIFSYNTLKPLLSCDNKIFTYIDNKETYILGFKESEYNNEGIIGKWILINLSGTIDSLTIIAKDSTIYDMSLHFILPDKFYYNENESNSYYFKCLEEVNIFGTKSPDGIYFYMQSPENNDAIKKSKISIINNRFSTKYKNKTFILGID